MLRHSRWLLARALESRLRGSTVYSLRYLTQLADDWFQALKDWEKEETFYRAFNENRMTLRLLNADPGRSKNDYVRNVPGWMATRQDDGTFKKTGVSTEVFLSGGLTGLKDRLNPDNFKRRGPSAPDLPLQSRKNALGLHDLSGRLLDRRFRISRQGFNFDKTRHAVFMPIPAEEDHVVFYALSYVAKSDPELRANADFVEFVRFMRARLSRIKLAEGTDMGASFVVLRDPETDRVRIRYGYTGKVTKTETAAPAPNADDGAPKLDFLEQIRRGRTLRSTATTAVEDTSPTLTAEQVLARITGAWKYKAMLRTAMELGNNEIIIAYRQHASSDFPMITTWPDRDENPLYHVVKSASRLSLLYDDGKVETL